MAQTNLPINGTFSVTAVFGQAGQYWANGHKGIDIVAGDTRIFATCNGVVSFVGYDAKGWGYYVSICPDNAPNDRHILCHMVKGSIKVKKGDRVNRLTVIGTMGATGNVTGVHVHFELRKNNVAVDPSGYLGIPNKKGNYNAKDYVIEQSPAIDYKAKYDAEVKAHEATKAEYVRINSKISAAIQILQ